MTADGSEVFFTTKDKLTTATNQDTDESADLYEAEVTEAGATLNRLSTGEEGTGNTDACDPVANEIGPHWNSLEAAANCGVLAIGGGGGVAPDRAPSTSSPPRCCSANGTQNQPNLYLAAPGQPPRFVATLEPRITPWSSTPYTNREPAIPPTSRSPPRQLRGLPLHPLPRRL